jgi:hypothetical protein
MSESFLEKSKAFEGFYFADAYQLNTKALDGVIFVKKEELVGLGREADAALAVKDAEIARLQPRKIAPVQGYYPGIPWDMHLRAYAAYCKKWSPQKALVEGNCRGGFGTEELDEFIPGWLDEISERTRLTTLIVAQKELIEFYSNYISGVTGYMVTHQVGPSSEIVAEGERLRARIRSLENG